MAEPKRRDQIVAEYMAKTGVVPSTLVAKTILDADQHVTDPASREQVLRASAAILFKVVRDSLVEGDYRVTVAAVSEWTRVVGARADVKVAEPTQPSSLVGHPEYEQLKSLVRRVMERFPETVTVFREEWDALGMDE